MTLPVVLGGAPNAEAQLYSAKLLGIQNSNLIAYFPFNETSGTTADNLEGTADRDGTYNNVTLNQTGIGDGNGAAQIIPANSSSSVDFDTASYVSAFNGDEGTVAVWLKVSGVGVWTDGDFLTMCTCRVDGDNEFLLSKSNSGSPNDLRWHYAAGGTAETITSAVHASTTGWFHMAITWSAAGDIVRAYFNGTEVSTSASLGTWVGDPNNRDVWGAGAITGDNSEWDGYIAHGAVWTTPLSAGNILKLATV